jgi:dCMP deaminase
LRRPEAQAPRKLVLLYLPVIHAGYEAFLDRHRDAAAVLVLGRSFESDFPVMHKEIRALDPERAVAYLVSAGIPARVVERADLPDAVDGDILVVPDEEIMRALVDRHGFDAVFERTFLRWDRSWSTAGRPPQYDGMVAPDSLGFMARAAGEAQKSSDWWRQVGAVAVRDGAVLLTAHNEHQPTEYAPYLNGDPRNDFSRGVRADLSTAMHAEAAIVARAARDGLSLRGAEIYVSTFPCPACARLIAGAGFTTCFFAGPYAVLDGDEILRAAGVQLVWVTNSP